MHDSAKEIMLELLELRARIVVAIRKAQEELNSIHGAASTPAKSIQRCAATTSPPARR